MALEAKHNNVILYNLFTNEETSFFNHIDLELEKIDSAIEKENIRLNKLKAFYSNIRNLPQAQNNLLDEAKEIGVLIDQNIQLLQADKQEFTSIDKSIVNLLIEIENLGANFSQSAFSPKIENVKAKIISFSNLYENLKIAIEENDKRIDRFLSLDVVKQYMPESQFERLHATYNTPEVKKARNVEFEINTSDIAENNNVLLISGKRKKVFLPYSQKEVLEYLKQYPEQYKSFKDVVMQEFIMPLDTYQKHPVLSRFRETYSLIRDREAKSILEAFKFAMDIMFNYNLNPAVIAACKTQEQLENYLSCLEKNTLDKFTDFEIQFEMVPFKV